MKLLLLFLCVPALAWAQTHPRVKLETSLGAVVVELFPEKAPVTVENFLRYVGEGFYDGTVFHRVVPGFVVQGGGYTEALAPKKTRGPIKNEAANGLSNRRGTVAMARTAEVDSATSQFFINLVDNPFLDHRDNTPKGYGYCVFGQVVEGMEVVDAMAQVPTGAAGPFPQDVPLRPIILLRAYPLAGENQPKGAPKGQISPP